MKKNILKYTFLLVALIVIAITILYKKKYKFVYIENEKQKICQKCIIIDNQYYCQTFNLKEKECDK